MDYLRFTFVALVCAGCTTNVDVVKSDENVESLGPKAQQLQKDLAPYCKDICDELSGCLGGLGSCECTSTTAAADCPCASSGNAFDDCLGTCLRDIGTRFLYHGETCAAAGEAVLECYANLTCNPPVPYGANGEPCGLDQAKVLCPLDGDTVEIHAPPSGVTCAGTSGAGNAVADTSADGFSQFCFAETSLCSDGRVYRVACNATIADSVMCACLVDGVEQSTFEDPVLLSQAPSGAACNSWPAANARCGWSFSVPAN